MAGVPTDAMLGYEAMINLEETYGDKFFRNRSQYNWRAPIVATAINDIFHSVPLKSVVDVGAAVGDLVKGFADLGISAYGIEGSSKCLPYIVCDKDRFFIHDMRQPVASLTAIPYPLDLVTCWEVAEHIDAEFADVFVDNLCTLAPRVLMSACPPQTTSRKSGSVGHVHEMPYEYWEEMFLLRGYERGEKREVPRYIRGRRQIAQNEIVDPSLVRIWIESEIECVFRDLVVPWSLKWGIKAWFENLLYFEKKTELVKVEKKANA